MCDNGIIVITECQAHYQVLFQGDVVIMVVSGTMCRRMNSFPKSSKHSILFAALMKKLKYEIVEQAATLRVMLICGIRLYRLLVAV